MQRTVQTIILVIILLLQVIFLLIAWNNKTSITLANIIAILNLLLIASGFLIVYYFGLRQIKEELLLNKKMEIYEKLAKLGISFRNHFSFKLTVYMKFELEKKIKSSSEENEEGTKTIEIGEELFSKYINPSLKKFQKFDDYARIWLAVIPHLEKAYTELYKSFLGVNKRLNQLHKKISQDLFMSFMDVSYTNTDTTPKLRKEKIRKIKKDIISQINELEKEMNDLGNYMDSFIYELVASELKIALFNKRARITIENVKKGQPHNKLTKNGIKKVPYEPTGFEILSKDKK